MRSRLLGWLSRALLLAVASCGGADDGPYGNRAAREALRSARVGAWEAERPVALAFSGDTAFVVGGAREVLLYRLPGGDGNTPEVTALGIRGTPAHLDLNAGAFYIDGDSFREFRVVSREDGGISAGGGPFDGRFAVTSAGTVLTQAGSASLGLLLRAHDQFGVSRGARFGYVPSGLDLRPAHRRAGEAATSRLVAVTPGDTVHVFDNRLGTLFKFDPTGDLVLFRRLPDAELKRLARELKPRYGQPDPAFALALRRTCEGDLILTLNGARRPRAYLVDARSYALHRISDRILEATGGSTFYKCGERFFGVDPQENRVGYVELG